MPISETLIHPQLERQAESASGLAEKVRNPEVSLPELLKEAGLEGLGSEERLGLIEHATLEDYEAAISAIHRKVASDHSHEPHPEAVKIINPKTGEVSAVAALPHERAEVLDHALDVAKKVAQKYRAEGGMLDDVLQRCGNVLAFGAVLAHIYENGNGRSARALGELIHNGFDSSDPESVANLEVLSANRPEKGFRINSYAPSLGWGEGRANKEPESFLEVVAGLDQPFDGASYPAYARGLFTTPRM